MRTKFKAWHKHLNQMYEVYAIFWDEGIVYCRSDEGTTHTFGFMEVEFLEYTGLKDRNGKEIYEGDIVKRPLGGFGIVKFHESWGSFYCSTFLAVDEYGKLVKASSSVPFWNDSKKFEAIGNIYEDPELVGDKA